MTTGIANTKSRRFWFDAESLFETTAAGAGVNPPGYTEVTVNPDQEALERDEPLNSFGDLYGADPGAQLFDASVSVKQTKQTYANWKRLFTASYGVEETGGAITITAASCTQSMIRIASGTPGPILYVLGHDGLVYHVPVKSFTSGTDANLAMQLPAAAVGATMTAFNPSAKTGGVFKYVLGGSASTFVTAYDRSGQTKQVRYKGWGCAVSAGVFLFELRKRLLWQFGFKGSRWEKDVSVACADPDPTTNPFISFMANAHLYQYNAVAAESNRTVFKKIAFSFAPTLLDEEGTKGLDGSGVTPGSPITGYTRAENWVQRLATQHQYPDPAWYDRWDPNNPDNYYGLFVEFFSAKPAKAPSAPRMSIWFPYIIQTKNPVLTGVNNGEAMDLLWMPGRDPATSLAAGYLAMTNT